MNQQTYSLTLALRVLARAKEQPDAALRSVLIEQAAQHIRNARAEMEETR